jgi:hypothetical protein
VDYDIGAEVANQPIYKTPVRDAVLDQAQTGMRLQIIPSSGLKIIDHDDLVTPSEQQVDDGRADEP